MPASQFIPAKGKTPQQVQSAIHDFMQEAADRGFVVVSVVPHVGFELDGTTPLAGYYVFARDAISSDTPQKRQPSADLSLMIPA